MIQARSRTAHWLLRRALTDSCVFVVSFDAYQAADQGKISDQRPVFVVEVAGFEPTEVPMRTPRSGTLTGTEQGKDGIRPLSARIRPFFRAEWELSVAAGVAVPLGNTFLASVPAVAEATRRQTCFRRSDVYSEQATKSPSWLADLYSAECRVLDDPKEDLWVTQ